MNHLTNHCQEEFFQTKKKIIYRASNETGKGTMTFYELETGIYAIYHDFQMESIESRFTSNQSLFVIDYALQGRMEQEMNHKTFSYLKPGYCKLDSKISHNGNFYFPLSYYHGISIGFDIEKAQPVLDRAQGIQPISLLQIQKKFCEKYPVYIIRNHNKIDKLFEKMEESPNMNHVYTLLDILNSMKPNHNQPKYFNTIHTMKVKEIHEYIQFHLKEHLTIDFLSKIFDIPTTSLKICFKEIYGQPIHSYIRLCRLKKSCELLIHTQMQVKQICQEIGYRNPSKFAEFFRQEIGISPMEYRIQNRKGDSI